jgi:anti-sigma B factor antagonist
VEEAGVTLLLTMSKQVNAVVQIVPTGEIDVDNAYQIREAVAAQLADTRPDRIELDLHRVSFIDSVGISALVAAFQVAAVGGVKLVVTRPSRFAHRQLWATGLLGLFGAPEPYTPAEEAPEPYTPVVEAPEHPAVSGA